jgi:hypothetical protein
MFHTSTGLMMTTVKMSYTKTVDLRCVDVNINKYHYWTAKGKED